GFDEEVVERVEVLQRELLEYQRSGVAPGGLDERLAAALAEPWAGAAELPSELWSPEDYTWWRSVMDFDPLPHWRAIDCPVLLVSGGRDTRSEVAESQQRIAAAIERVGAATARALVFPAADHAVLEWPLGEGTPPPRWPDGYRAAVVCWLREVTALEPMPSCLAAFDAPGSVAAALMPEPPADASRTNCP
ncbi:MAG: hypothetical protein R3244_04030, partial [Thermoanaerobaculia bacterium]|nr:hypothetical protein [Thermoanaerobaculia bacterium]